MTRTLLTIVFFLTITFAHGQDRTNNFFVGLNGFAQVSNSTEETINQSSGNSFKTNNKSYNLNLLPQVGFKFDRNVRVGIALGYQREQTKSKQGIDTPDPYHIYNRTNLYTGRAYLSKDFRLSNWLNFFLQGNIDFLKEREIREDYNSQQSGLYSHRAYYFSPNIIPGLRASLKNQLDIEITYGRMGYLKGKLITDAGGVDSDYTLKRFDLNFASNTITVGLKYNFK